MSQYLEILKQAKSYKVNRSKINDENQKMGAKIEETAFNKRNNCNDILGVRYASRFIGK